MKSKNIEHTWNTIRDFGMFTDRPNKMPAMDIPVPPEVLGKTFNWVHTDPSPDTFQNYFRIISSGRKIALYFIIPFLPFALLFILMAKYQMEKNKQFVRFDLRKNCVEFKTWLLEGRSKWTNHHVKIDGTPTVNFADEVECTPYKWNAHFKKPQCSNNSTNIMIVRTLLETNKIAERVVLMFRTDNATRLMELTITKIESPPRDQMGNIDRDGLRAPIYEHTFILNNRTVQTSLSPKMYPFLQHDT